MNKLNNAKALSLRIITGVVLILLVLAWIEYASQAVFLLTSAIVVFIAAWEWIKLLGWNKKPVLVLLYFLLVILFMFVGLVLPAVFTIAVASLWWFFVLVCIVLMRIFSTRWVIPKWLVASSGVFILMTCWITLLVLHLYPNVLIFLLLIVWTSDIAAYFGGSLLGKHKLAPEISPNKSWEGLFCGLVAVLVVAYLGANYYLGASSQVIDWMKVSVMTFVAAVIGDLFESLLKRQAALKDSGHLLPGHGGLLDRVDSLLAAAPVFATGLIALHLI